MRLAEIRFAVYETAALPLSYTGFSYGLRRFQSFESKISILLFHSDSNRLTASTYTDSNTWEYKLPVIAMELCPNLSNTILIGKLKTVLKTRLPCDRGPSDLV